jgi:hypothetical protein
VDVRRAGLAAVCRRCLIPKPVVVTGDDDTVLAVGIHVRVVVIVP